MNNQLIKQLPGAVKKYGQIFVMGLLIGTLGYLIMCRAMLHSVIIGTSMEPTLINDEQTYGIRVSGLIRLKRGDIVSFYPTVDSNGHLYVKRIIGLPGETVVVDDGKVYIDGELLDEPYLDEEWTDYNGPFKFEVPAGHYLVLGDNRNGSYDSRLWENPYVPYASIEAKTYFAYRPGNGLKCLY